MMKKTIVLIYEVLIFPYYNLSINTQPEKFFKYFGVYTSKQL